MLNFTNLLVQPVKEITHLVLPELRMAMRDMTEWRRWGSALRKTQVEMERHCRSDQKAWTIREEWATERKKWKGIGLSIPYCLPQSKTRFYFKCILF